MEALKALSLSYKNTPIELREQVSMESQESGDFLLKLKDVFGIGEALLISTCNRTEIYYTHGEDLSSDIIALITTFKGIKGKQLIDHFQQLNGEEACNHLFRVSLGLESSVLGDIQISNQVKRAYQQSADLNLAGPYLHRLMHTIFYANKRVVQETRLQDGSASVASIAVDIIQQFVSKIENPRVALIGLGEIGQNTLENLNKEDLHITLVNRTRSKAEKFADHENIEVQDYENLKSVINYNDVIISAVATDNPIITADLLNLDNPLHKLFIDLSVPRSIDPAIEEVTGISVFNVDQLTQKTLKAKSIREKAIPDAENIIADSLHNFSLWKSEMEVSPTIQRLKSTLDQIRREELSRYSKASDAEMKLLEVATKNMVQKLIKLPVLQLKAACKRGEADTLVEVLNDLFNLEAQPADKK